MEDKKEKLPSTRIQCEKTIYRKFIETFENTHFFTYRFFVFDAKNRYDI